MVKFCFRYEIYGYEIYGRLTRFMGVYEIYGRVYEIYGSLRDLWELRDLWGVQLQNLISYILFVLICPQVNVLVAGGYPIFT